MVYGGSGFGGVVCWLSRQTTACRSTTVGSSLEVLRILYPSRRHLSTEYPEYRFPL
jgi:hypothetical protein